MEVRLSRLDRRDEVVVRPFRRRLAGKERQRSVANARLSASRNPALTAPEENRPTRKSVRGKRSGACRTREGRLAPALAVQPGHTQTLGFFLQMLAQSDREEQKGPSTSQGERMGPPAF